MKITQVGQIEKSGLIKCGALLHNGCGCDWLVISRYENRYWILVRCINNFFDLFEAEQVMLMNDHPQAVFKVG